MQYASNMVQYTCPKNVQQVEVMNQSKERDHFHVVIYGPGLQIVNK